MTGLISRSNCVIFLFGLAMMLCTGCASIIHPGPDSVTLNSQPSGATVYIDGNQVGQTPLTTLIGRKAETVSFSLPGYEETKVPIQRHLNGWVFGNIIFGGVIGLVVDVVTGNASEAEPTMKVDLHRSSSASTEYQKSPFAWFGARTSAWMDPSLQLLDIVTP